MSRSWKFRSTSSDLAESYESFGYWNDQTFAELAFRGLHAFGETPVSVHSKVRPYRGSVSEVGDSGLRLAQMLRSKGIQPGDVVAFQLPNWCESVATYYGLLALGVVLVPIVHIYGHKEVAYILKESGAKVLITAAEFGRQDYLNNLEEISKQLADLELLVVVGDQVSKKKIPSGSYSSVTWARAVRDHAPIDQPATVDPAEPVIVGYTSGTTSDPKGVIHSHRSFLAEMRTLADFGIQDRSLVSQPSPGGSITASPISHVTGMIGAVRPLFGGGQIHLMDAWDPGAVFSLMESDGLGISGGATFFLTSLLDHPQFRVECHVPMMGRVSLGGSPVPEAIVRRARDLGISVTRAYGSTEHPSTTMSLHSDPEDKRLYTDGRVLPGSEVKIVDDNGRSLPSGTVGEILSRGPELFVGYIDARLNSGTFTSDGWYRTGDIGVLDRDGYLTITDRKKDIIIRGGENISAQEVEDTLQNFAGVAEVAVIAMPDPRYGEHACAVIRVQPGCERFTINQMRTQLERTGLARQKWPEELQFVSAFPRTGSGKVQKHVLREQLRNPTGRAS